MLSSLLYIVGFLLTLFVSTCESVAASSGGESWHYEGHNGPSKWQHAYPDCGHHAQSPIDINEQNAKYSDKLNSITLNNYDVAPTRLTLKNNGHSAQVDVVGDQFISGGNLSADFKLLQFHFHWGSDNSKGSEHYIDGRQYPMEMHFVHYDASKGSAKQASQQKNGLAVLGFMFEISDKHNHAFDPIIHHLHSIRFKGESRSIRNISLRSLLPENLNFYYNYGGSLTTPPCYESVEWNIFRSTISISNEQLKQFRSLYSNEKGEGPNEPLENNFRPLQALNGRTVWTNGV